MAHPFYVCGRTNDVDLGEINFGQFMINNMKTYGDKVALINVLTKEETTYRDIVRDAINISISLTRLGVRKGDTVAICSENRHEYYTAVTGIVCAGACVTHFNSTFTKDELTHIMNISKPKVVVASPSVYKTQRETFTTSRFVEKIILFGTVEENHIIYYEDLKKPRTDIASFKAVEMDIENDNLFILYSSGTTGLPKGVMLTHLAMIASCSLSTILDPNKSTLTIIPWYHSMGILFQLALLRSGSKIFYLPKFEINVYLDTIDLYKIQQLIVVPPIILSICKAKSNHDLQSVEVIFSSAAPIKDNTVCTINNRFPNLKAVLQGYGLTETSFVTADTYDKLHLSKAGGVGTVVNNAVIKVVDPETRKPLGPNDKGEICVKGLSVMKGYVGRDKIEDFDDEDFFRTGDIGYYDEDKYFFIVDRLKELIKYKGYQVSPAEIESVLLQHPSIQDAGVAGIPDDTAGELPRAFVVLQPGKTLSEGDVKQFVTEKLSNPKHLRGGVKFVNAIPKNPSGKILRKALKELPL